MPTISYPNAPNLLSYPDKINSRRFSIIERLLHCFRSLPSQSAQRLVHEMCLCITPCSAARLLRNLVAAAFGPVIRPCFSATASRTSDSVFAKYGIRSGVLEIMGLRGLTVAVYRLHEASSWLALRRPLLSKRRRSSLKSWGTVEVDFRGL